VPERRQGANIRLVRFMSGTRGVRPLELEHELDRRSGRLCAVYDAPGFAEAAAATVEALGSHLTRSLAGHRPVWRDVSAEELLSTWPRPDPSSPTSPVELLRRFMEDSTAQHHPGFVGQQLPAPPPVASLAAMVSALTNNSAAIFEGAPAGVVVEHRVLEWFARAVGYGPASDGVLTSGGTLGALTALLAMRQATIDGDVWAEGVDSRARHVVFVSEESHYCNRRACAVAGMGERSAVSVPTDSAFRMDLNALRARYEDALHEGSIPIGVVGSAGTTSTGSYDPIAELAGFCRERRLWLHVDAAHGGCAALSPRYASLVRGLEEADSIVWDAHKMLMAPSLCTAVLFRDRRRLDETFRQDAAYLLGDSGAAWKHPASRNFETTKPALGLPFYVLLRTLGERFLREWVEYSYDLARAFADEIERREGVELLLRPESNIICFRLGRDVEDRDELQLAARASVNREGGFFIMKTTLRGEVWLRAVIMSPATRLAHLRELLDELERS